MSTDNLITIMCGTVGVILYFIERRNKPSDKSKENIIRSEVTSIQLINPEAAKFITMTADIGPTISTSSSTKKSTVPVTSAYKHTIGLSNIGTEAMKSPGVDVSFDHRTHILNFDVSSKHIPRDQIEILDNIHGPNHRRVIPKYMNTKQGLTISVISINNERMKYPVVPVGTGIKHRKAEEEFRVASQALLNAAFITITLFVAVILVNQFGSP